MKTVIICHEDSPFSHYVLPRWLASFSDLVGIIVLKDSKQQIIKRIKHEVLRVGTFRFLDVLAFRMYYRLFQAKKDKKWEQEKLTQLYKTYPEMDFKIPKLITSSPNNNEAIKFVKQLEPDIMIARCKTLLSTSMFSIPSKGTFVMHPGVCPEYRNSHGCFWALVNYDYSKIGMTLLKIDRGVDTGPVYGYYGADLDYLNESHIVIQQKVVIDNLDAIQQRLFDIYNNVAMPINTKGRNSCAWGQPWLSSYLKWKFNFTRKQK